MTTTPNPTELERGLAAITAAALDELTAVIEQIERRCSYRGQPVCPRCSDGLPNCTEPGWNHRHTCEVYQWADDLCADCTVDLAA